MKRILFTVTTFILCITLFAGCNGGSSSASDNTNLPLSLSSNHTDTTIPVELLALRFDDYENLSISEYRIFGIPMRMHTSLKIF